MTRKSILSDELVRQLVAVGKVDVLVGVPTFNNASTVESVVKTLHTGLAKHFPRERTLLINPDGGSDDGTPDRVRNAPMADEELRTSSTLRTTHRVSVSYDGIPGRAAGVRTVFAAADLLQARAVVLVDPDVTSITPDWVAELARPIVKGESDIVLPVHPRHPFGGPLLTQLVRPLLSAAYARRLHSNLAGDFGCSGRFAARLVGHDLWNQDLSRQALDVWLVATAMADDLRLTQTHLGPCTFSPRTVRANLPELFEQVVGSVFSCLEQHSSSWLHRPETKDVELLGEPHPAAEAIPEVDPAPMAERFRSGVRDLAPLLREILTPGTLARLQAAGAPGAAIPHIPDSLWVTTVYEFAASSHQRVMNREHMTQALVPLYLGRTASFFAEIAAADETTHAQRLSALEREYEGLRPYLVERWTAEGRR